MLDMNRNREYFINYLKKLDLFSVETEALFDLYYNELIETNKNINLFSRKMDLDDIWTVHFMDSISITEIFNDWKHKTVLDFGTGGGLPGIPVKILNPECQISLLDSTRKKIDAVRKIVSKLSIDNVSYLNCRLEDKAMQVYNNFFDVILCRSVKITPELQKSLEKLVKKSGKIFLYKAINYEDAELFRDIRVHKLDLKLLGERRIIEINYG